MNNSPIGIFDSGVGGLSIWLEIQKLLPQEHTIYLADSKNAPYGEKSREQILNLSIKNTEFLLNKGCKLIVVACNTATTNAIEHLRAHYPIPFIGIEPAIKPAALQSNTKTVGVLATKGTLGSHLFHYTSQHYANDITIVEQEGTGLVTLIEAGKVNSKETKTLLQQYLKPMIRANMDHLVLGCTHYPFLIPVIKNLIPKEVKIVDCGQAVANQVLKILDNNALSNNATKEGNHIFYTNSDPKALKTFLLGSPAKVEIIQDQF